MSLKFIDYFEQWVKSYRTAGRSLVTRQKYDLTANHIRQHSIAEMDIRKIKRVDIQQFMNDFGKTRRKQTVLDLGVNIKGCFGDAVLDGYIKVNPYARIEINSKESEMSVEELKELREQKKWLEFDEYKKLKRYLIGVMHQIFQQEPIRPKYYCQQVTVIVIYVALKTGMRFSEILGLTEMDIDYENCSVYVEKTWDYKNRTGFLPTKNFASIRSIAVDREFLQVISIYLDWCKQNGIRFDRGAIFVEERVNVYNAAYNDLLKLIFAELGIEYISMHKLRHTQASILVAKGIALQVVAKRLGHTDTNMIQKVYAHLLKSVEEKENERLVKLL